MAMLPVCPPGLGAVTVVTPAGTGASTRNVTLLPLALTTWAVTPPTVTLTLGAPNPLPVRVTVSPTAAQAGMMLLMWQAAAKAAGGTEHMPAGLARGRRESPGRQQGASTRWGKSSLLDPGPGFEGG